MCDGLVVSPAGRRSARSPYRGLRGGSHGLAARRADNGRSEVRLASDRGARTALPHLLLCWRDDLGLLCGGAGLRSVPSAVPTHTLALPQHGCLVWAESVWSSPRLSSAG